MKDNKTIRIAVADAKSFERGSFRTYVLDEQNGVTVVTASITGGPAQVQTFIFDLAKNSDWNFENADAYVKASTSDVNKLAAAVKGSATFKTLAQAANSGIPVAIDKVRSGLRIASLDAGIYDNLLKANKDGQAEIDYDKIPQGISSGSRS